MARGYTRAELLEKIEASAWDMAIFYQQGFVNYLGRTTDTREFDTEVVAEWCCSHLDLFDTIPQITRETSYKTPGHDGTYDPASCCEEEIAVNYLAKHVGPAFILMSAMNVERVMTAYHMAQKTGRIFLEDIYTANVAAAAGTLAPEPGKDPGVRVFTTGGDRQYQQMQKYERVKIGREASARTPFVMCVRSSMKDYLNKLSEQMSFEDGVLFYGM